VSDRTIPAAGPAPPVQPPVADVAAIRTDRLSKRYGRVLALHELALRVDRGEIFGFLGPNGAGKSTTIRVLLGFLHPTSGRAEVLGLDTVSESVAIRRRIGYVPGGVAFDDTISGQRALDELAALQQAPSIRRDELCERLQLPAETLRRRVRDYSRGTRQKLASSRRCSTTPSW
jgi:ABC-2 type transport system ATP-binding protein